MFLNKKILLLALTGLWGCSAIDKGIRYSELDVQTQMSQSIFLDPAPESVEKTLYLEVRNTSDRQQIRLKDPIAQAFQSRGYRIVAQASQASYVVQINLLNAQRIREARDAWGSLRGGVVGGASGLALGSFMAPEQYSSYAVASLVGAGIGSLIDSAVEVINYTMITDVRITQQKPLDRKSFATRIVSLANKVNLDFDEAVPALRKGLIDSLVGLFE